MNDLIIDNLIREAFAHYNNSIQYRQSKRLEKTIIMSKIKIKIINETIECPICMITKNKCAITTCNHKFCIDCIKRIDSIRCPYCRQ
jgi:hypothetical protein